MTTPVYHAILDDQPGLLAMIDQTLTFCNTATGERLPVTPPLVNFLRCTAEVPAYCRASALRHFGTSTVQTLRQRYAQRNQTTITR